MASTEKKHDYHLVEPSPWPIFCSIASLILAVGAVYYFRTKYVDDDRWFSNNDLWCLHVV